MSAVNAMKGKASFAYTPVSLSTYVLASQSYGMFLYAVELATRWHRVKPTVMTL